ncbi:MAG TPA: hypothetical protein GX500_05545 [Firmicutes bacterium]|nr:hypothetical protein [Candidatus Fermentithermobacillaceae bacterium]
MKILGFDATNPFSLFLILILLLAANGSFDPKSVYRAEQEGSGERQDQWLNWTTKPLFQRKGGPRLCLGRRTVGRRIRLQRELRVSMPKVMPLRK